MGTVTDLKALVRELAEALEAVHETTRTGFTIEVPLAGDRYQSVALGTRKARGVELLEVASVVTGLDPAATTTVESHRRKAKGVEIVLEPDGDGGQSVVVTASLPLAEATCERVRPLLLEVARAGDGIESELTGGDVD